MQLSKMGELSRPCCIQVYTDVSLTNLASQSGLAFATQSGAIV